MILELFERLLELGIWIEISIDDLRNIRNIDFGIKVIAIETITNVETGNHVFVLDKLTIKHEVLQRILSLHANPKPPAVRFFILQP